MISTYRIFILLSLFILTSGSRSQNIDSLKQLLKGNISDSSRVNLYVEIGETCADDDLETILGYSNLAIKFIKVKLQQKVDEKTKLYYLDRLSLAYNNVGFYYHAKNRSFEALKNYTNAIKIQRLLPIKSNLSELLLNVVLIFEEQKDIISAIQYVTQSLKLEKDESFRAYCYLSLGSLYNQCRNYNNAKLCFIKAQNLFEKLKDEQGLTETYNSLANFFKERQDFVRAIEYCEKAMKIEVNQNNYYGITQTLNTYAGVFQSKGDYKNAQKYYELALANYEKLDDSQGKATLLRNYAKLFFLQNDLDQAENYAKMAMAEANKSANMENIRDEAEMLYTIYKAKRSPKADQFCELSKIMSDSLSIRDMRNDSLFSIFKREYDVYAKNEHYSGISLEAESLKQTKVEKRGFLYFILVLVPILGILLYFFRRKK